MNMHKTQLALFILVMIVLFVLLSDHEYQFCLRSDNYSIDKSGTKYHLAFQESLGFFDDWPEDLWKIRKAASGIKDYQPPKNNTKAQVWYSKNWHPDFSCPLDTLVGPSGDGHKWVCDPHRIGKVTKDRKATGKNGCLVYSIGSKGNFGFEKALMQLLPMCEIHVFDFDDYENKIPPGLDIKYHMWGLGPSPATENSPYFKNTSYTGHRKDRLKSFQQIVKDLGHEGHVLDIFKIDCERCEWFTYQDWLSGILDIRQIQIELHETPPVIIDLIMELKSKNYVMFHKEPNLLWPSGIELSFLKLSDSFFNG